MAAMVALLAVLVEEFALLHNNGNHRTRVCPCHRQRSYPGSHSRVKYHADSKRP